MIPLWSVMTSPFSSISRTEQMFKRKQSQPAAFGLTTDKESQQISNSSESARHNQSPSQKTAVLRKPRHSHDVVSMGRWIVNHQIGISFKLLALLYITHLLLPEGKIHTRQFFRLSYFNPTTSRYALGWNDLSFVLHWIIVFTGLRCVTMDYMLVGLAQACNITKKSTRIRFAEQAWILIYYCVSWSTGVYIISCSNYWSDMRLLWRDWPDREMDCLSKWYYLIQFAFWLQQIIVVNIEERRKDYAQMLTHHIITCLLLFFSYGYHYSKAGTLVLCLVDIVDILFPAAKLLKYMQLQLACNIMFGIFMVAWFLTRHVVFLLIFYSIYAHVPTEMRYGCFQGNTQDLRGPLPITPGFQKWVAPFRDPEGLICFSDSVRIGFVSMLAALQVMWWIWFAMIVRVAYGALTGRGTDDPRSDGEDDEEDVAERANETK